MFFNDLQYGKNSLFCCNGYSHEIFTILFYESQVKELKKASTIEKKNFKVLMTFLLLKIGHGAKSNFDFKFKNEHCHQISSLYL